MLQLSSLTAANKYEALSLFGGGLKDEYYLPTSPLLTVLPCVLYILHAIAVAAPCHNDSHSIMRSLLPTTFVRDGGCSKIMYRAGIEV